MLFVWVITRDSRTSAIDAVIPSILILFYFFCNIRAKRLRHFRTRRWRRAEYQSIPPCTSSPPNIILGRGQTTPLTPQTPQCYQPVNYVSSPYTLVTGRHFFYRRPPPINRFRPPTINVYACIYLSNTLKHYIAHSAIELKHFFFFFDILLGSAFVCVRSSKRVGRRVYI